MSPSTKFFSQSVFLRRATMCLVFLLGCAAALWFAPRQFAFLTGGAETPPAKQSAPPQPAPDSNREAAARRQQKGEPDSTDGVWREVQFNSLNGRVADGVPETARALQLSPQALTKILDAAPDDSAERLTDLARTGAILTLPLPEGGFMRFRVADSPVMDAELSQKFPDIKSYRGQSLDDLRVSARLDFSPRGFNATILTADKMISIHPARHDDPARYVSYYGDGFKAKALGCGVTETVTRQSKADDFVVDENAPNAATGATLKKYRLAIATTQEYYNNAALGGGSQANAVASLNTWVGAVNAIYERELAVRFLLVGNTNIIFTAEPDGLTNNSNSMLEEIRPILESQVGLANYDVGHVLGDGAGGSGGVANVGVVCNASNFKGSGVTQINSPNGNPFGLHVFAHELGHQFGAPHSWNGCPPASTQRSSATAYEVGSGSTIMSYGGVCGNDNLVGTSYAANDKRFHAISLQNINTYLNTTSCAVTESTGNAAPVVDAGANYTIPKFTPFALTASATDANGDVPNLTYVWEQFDNGGALYANPPYLDSGDPATTTRPIFRNYAPTSSPTRYFPSLTYILNNANDPPDTAESGTRRVGEELPRIGRTMNFRVTARDNRSGAGGANDDTVTLNVDPNSGPFGITAPNTAATWTGGGNQTITWDVNNTNAAPVNAANVKISLSTDGGNTFPIVLAASTANDGSESIVVPNGVQTATARVKIEAVGNIFFDISDTNFTVNNGDACPVISGITPGAGNVGTAVTISGVNFTGVSAVKFGGNVSAAFTVVNNTTITTTVPAGAASGAITLSKPSCGDKQTSFFSVCASAPQNLAVDDGSINFLHGDKFYVNRLTPPSYPATLTHVQIYWHTSPGPAVGQQISVLAGTNADGDANINNTAFQSVSAVVQSVGAFNTYALPTPITITSGDFLVGYNLPAGSGASDGTAPDSRSYFSSDGVNFGLTTSVDYMIRAQYSTNCDAGATISPSAQNFNAAGGNGSIAVTTANAWTATANDSWITINSGASGTGNGTVVYSVANNNTGAPRTGTITVAGQTFTVTQDACAIGFAPASQTIDAGGGSFNIAVSAPAGCAWTAATSDSWITINSGASGTGDGVINYTVPIISTSASRTGSITIAGQTFTVTQTGCPGAPVTMRVDEDTLTNLGGGTYFVNRLTPTSYPATLTHVQIYFHGDTRSDGGGVPFALPVGSSITVLAGKNTDGDANINGAIQQTFAATVPSLRYDYTTFALPTPITISSGDFVVGFRVAPGVAALPLSMETADPDRGRSYFSGDNGATFNNDAAVDYKIRGQYQTYCQTGSISPTSRSHSGSGGNGTIVVSAAGAWTAFSNDPWITGGGSITGNGSITYTVAPNSTGAARTGTLTVAGQIFTVTQDNCLPILTPTSRTHGAAAASGQTVGFNIPAGCAWTATTVHPWITITGGASGTGDGTVTYSLDSNLSEVRRTGTIRIAGQNFTVTQDSFISGTISVGSGQTFTSLTRDEPGGLFKYLNGAILNGSLTVHVTSNLTSEDGAVALNQILEHGTGNYYVTIQPNGAPRTISGASTNGLIRLNGADRVVFDGVTPGGAALLLRNTASSAVIRLFNDARANAVGYATLEGQSASTTAGIVELLGGAVTGNDNNVIFANVIRNRSDASAQINNLIYANGSSGAPNSENLISANQLFGFSAAAISTGAAAGGENWLITGNTIYQTVNVPAGSVVQTGIEFAALGTNTITENTIRNFNASGLNVGISLKDARDTTVSRNRIYGFATAATLQGIVFTGNAASEAKVTAVNNQISIAPAASGAAMISGISGGGAGAQNVFEAFYNSVYIGGAATGSNSTHACQRPASVNGSGGWHNNICYNNRTGGTGSHYAMSDQSATAPFASNFNFLVGRGATNVLNFMLRNSTPMSFSDWTTNTGYDSQSSARPFFSANSNIFTDAANGNLDINHTTGHAATLALILNQASPFGNPTAIDFGGAARDARFPDVGADEFDAVLTIPAGGMNRLAVNANDNITLDGNVTVSGGASVTGALTLGGTLNVGIYTLSIGCGGSIAGASETNYVIGKIAKEFCTTGTFVFPTGENGYTPLSFEVISLNTNPSTVTVDAVDAVLPGFSATNAVSRHWTISGVNNSLTANLIFQYLEADTPNTASDADETNLVLHKRASGTTTEQGGALDAANNRVTKNGVSSFSEWGIAPPGAPTSAAVEIGGRVMTADGRGVSKARVILTAPDGATRIFVTNPFGYYRFNNVAAGNSYVLTADSKRHQFAPQVLMVTDNVSDLNFYAAP